MLDVNIKNIKCQVNNQYVVNNSRTFIPLKRKLTFIISLKKGLIPMKWKKNVFFLLVCTSALSAQISFEEYVNKFVHASNIIACAKVINVKVTKHPKNNFLSSTFTLQISSSLKGGRGKKKLHLYSPGGTMNGDRIYVAGRPEINVGDELLVFLIPAFSDIAGHKGKYYLKMKECYYGLIKIHTSSRGEKVVISQFSSDKAIEQKYRQDNTFWVIPLNDAVKLIKDKI